jgi:hypothetical protein
VVESTIIKTEAKMNSKPWTMLMESPEGKKVEFEVMATSLADVKAMAKSITKGVYGRLLAAKPKN